MTLVYFVLFVGMLVASIIGIWQSGFKGWSAWFALFLAVWLALASGLVAGLK